MTSDSHGSTVFPLRHEVAVLLELHDIGEQIRRLGVHYEHPIFVEYETKAAAFVQRLREILSVRAVADDPRVH